MVSAVIELTHKLGITVVAEGVETVDQRDTLLDLGCVYGQGYLLGKPMMAQECAAALRV